MKKANFEDYSLSNDILKSLQLLDYKSPTPVQQQVIPTLLKGQDVIVKSQTGSGKTASFAIPICELVDWEENKPQALIITPTRELALQVKEDLFNIGRFKRIKVATIYGKSPYDAQVKALKQKMHIVVGTPGRLIDHIEQETIDLSNIKYLVIDEADEMLNMGFIDQIETIINKLPKQRVTTLLSATMPHDIERLCHHYMKDPIFCEIENQSKAIDRIIQEVYHVDERDKFNLLKNITMIENPDSCIIFCNKRTTVEEVSKELRRLDYSCKMIHGDMDQSHRTQVMNEFRQHAFRFLIATDVAARGIDIDHIALVVNYDIPKDSEVYVHRIGRTGRVNRDGKAITFVNSQENKFLADIEKLIDKKLINKDQPHHRLVENKKEEFIEKRDTAPEVKETKGAKLSEGILKLHINAGKKTKMRPVDVVGTLCNIEGMTADDIGIIHIEDISTFVEILNNKGELVYKALQNKPIKGRMRKVSKVIYDY